MTKARDLASATPVPSAVSATELGYLDGVTSAVQTQITDTLAVANAKTTIAQGTNAARPTGSLGDLYFDTTYDTLYQKSSSGWIRAGSGIPVTLEALVIAGGGGGGAWIAGGGGAGGVAYHSSKGVAPSVAYTVTVGAGGTGALNSGNDGIGSPYHVGFNGADSYFDVIRAFGGGGGGGNGGATAYNGLNGGSGGGGQQGRSSGSSTQTSNNGATGYGFAGGATSPYSNYTGAGGGGAGGLGGAINGTTGGAGGVGLSTWSAWGNAVSLGHNVSGTRWFAGGGGGTGSGAGGAASNGGGGSGGKGTTNGTAGLANTGGGAGAADYPPDAPNGGSGVVIIRYADTAPPVTTITSGLTYTTATTGGYRYYAFTAGTGTVTW